MEIRLSSPNDLNEWRAAARALLLAGIQPEEVNWADPAQAEDLFGTNGMPPAVMGRKVGVVPARFLALAAAAICHSDPGRFALLYSLLWRLQKDRTILAYRDDTDVGKLYRRVEAVTAEAKRMTNELHFRRAVAADGHKGIAAWFEPKHYVLERVAPNFTREYRHEHWTVATPYRTAFWDGKRLSFGPAASATGRAVGALEYGRARPNQRRPRW